MLKNEIEKLSVIKDLNTDERFDQTETSSEEHGKSQTSKNLIKNAYHKIAALTKQLLTQQKYPREDLIKTNKAKPHPDPDTRQLLDELDFAYGKLKEYESAISVMSRSI